MSTRRPFVSHQGGLPPKPKPATDPRRRKKKPRPLPQSVKLFRLAAEQRARAIEAMPTACCGCQEVIGKLSLFCGTLEAGTVLPDGHVLEEPFPFRLALCEDCGLGLLRTGELLVTLQKAAREPDPWPGGIGRGFEGEGLG